MTKTIIHLDGELPVKVLDAKGWTQGRSSDAATGAVCAHQAIRLCAPVPGDAYLIEQVADRKWGRGPDWNDDEYTTEADVRAWLSQGIDVTDDDLADTFGSNWWPVVQIVRQAATMTLEQASSLADAWDAAWDAAWADAWDAAWDAAWAAAWVVAQVAAWNAAQDAAQDAAWNAVVWDLATEDGPFTFAHRDQLIAPWEQVFGLPEGLAR